MAVEVELENILRRYSTTGIEVDSNKASDAGALSHLGSVSLINLRNQAAGNDIIYEESSSASQPSGTYSRKRSKRSVSQSHLSKMQSAEVSVVITPKRGMSSSL